MSDSKLNRHSPLDVLTVVTAPSVGFELTWASITKLLDAGFLLVWHIVVGAWDEDLRHHLFSLDKRFLDSIHVHDQVEAGIYQAINQGLGHVQGDYFVIVHSGDVLYSSLWDHLPSANQELVHCFESDWHDMGGNKIRFQRALPVTPRLGRMPHHQTMIFPRSFLTMEYHSRFPISADQHLKL